MASKATVKFGSKEFDLIKCDFALHRDVDAKGRPSSGLYGGLINLTIESTDDTTIWDSMINKAKPVDGTVTFFKDDEDSKMKEVKWEKGFVVSYKEGIETRMLNAERLTQGVSENMLIHFTVSAEKVTVGSTAHENEWPKA